MGKKTKVTQKQKQKHYFILKGAKGLYFKNKIQADFTSSKHQNNKPMFNLDGKYYTPSFIVPSQHQNNNSKYEQEHYDKIKSTQQKSQSNIFVPRPKPSKTYCGVCAKDYGDYLEHIKSKQHIEQLRNSQFYKQIGNLCQKFKCLKNQTQNTKNINDSISSIKTKLVSDNQQQEQFAFKEGLTQFRSEGEVAGYSLV